MVNKEDGEELERWSKNIDASNKVKYGIDLSNMDKGKRKLDNLLLFKKILNFQFFFNVLMIQLKMKLEVKNEKQNIIIYYKYLNRSNYYNNSFFSL